MSKIQLVNARQIFDSRGNPTVECTIKTSKGHYTASVPSGASTGAHEAHELRDGGKKYNGLGVSRAVKNINIVIAKKIKGKDSANQELIDELMLKLDGTKNKSRLGANAILAVSMAAARAGAGKKELYEHIAEIHGSKKFELPVPAFNIINGGKHAGNKLAIQEYQILPTGAKSFSEAMRIGTEIYHQLKRTLEHDYGKQSINVGDEGGFAPAFTCIENPLEYISDAIIRLGYWKKVKIGIDSAATSFWKHKYYHFDGKQFTTEQLLEKYETLADTYPIVSIEDPFYEEDFQGFSEICKAMPKLQIIGDDLLCTNPVRIQKAIKQKSCNCLLLKMNQIGTVSEALKAAKLSQDNKWNVQVSHRSGETCDDFIADLSVGINSGQIKAGAPCRGERLAKYNRLLKIEEQLGRKVKYAGKNLKFA